MGLLDTLLPRIIHQESRGDPNAVSPDGAMGLMQVMPGTAKSPGFGIAPLEDPFDPGENVRFGRDYFGAMLNRYEDDPEAALVAYNWGPGNADKWVAGGKNFSALPAETQGYVKNILGGSAPQMEPMRLGPPDAISNGETGVANGLLGDAFSDPMLHLGAGLLAASGPSLTPVSTGQAFGQGLQQASIAQQLAQQNELKRQALTQKTDRMSTDIATMQALGIPQTPEGFAQFNKMKSGGTADQLRSLQVEELLSKLQGEREGKTLKEAEAETRIVSALPKLEELAALNNELEGTALSPGGGVAAEGVAQAAAPFSFLADRVGFNDYGAGELANKRARFKKLSNDFVVESIDRLSGAGVLSDSKLNLLKDSFASTESLPGANRGAISDAIGTLLTAADNKNIKIPERERWESLRSRLKGDDKNASDIKPISPSRKPPVGESVIPVYDLDGNLVQ